MKLSRHGGLTVFPKVLDEVAGRVVEQSRHVVVQRIHVLSQPVSCIIVDLETKTKTTFVDDEHEEKMIE